MIRGFYWVNREWHAKHMQGLPPCIEFGMYNENGQGGGIGEMNVIWKEFEVGKSVPQLCVFDDGWAVLESFADVIKEMAKHDNKNLTDQQFVELLKSCGFRDLTPYMKPEVHKSRHG